MSVGELIEVDPGTLVIGANVRTRKRTDDKAFRASIKERGVQEPITAHRTQAGELVVLRGQRRAVVAAEVGLAKVPVRVVDIPAEADRIIDQIGDNVHRAAMGQDELADAVEQLTLLGLSVAAIARRTAMPRHTVQAAQAVVGSQAGRAKLLEHNLTIEDAAIFAEFGDAPEAVEVLERALQRGEPLKHTAQRLRDEAAEKAAQMTEVLRLRAQGLPVLDPDAQESRTWRRCALENLRRADGQQVPQAEWPTVPGAALVVRRDWDSDQDDDPAWTAVWVCTDPAAAGLHHYWDNPTPATTPTGATPTDEAAAQEAARAQRREVIANNRAWRSAETVRREWLGEFLARKTPPRGADQVIARAVLTGQTSLWRAMSDGHPHLLALLGLDAAAGHRTRWRDLLEPRDPKAAAMLTLGAVLAAWDQASGVHTWRQPGPWDRAVMTALNGWGYQPSTVEQLLLTDAATGEQAIGEQATDTTPA